MTFLFNNNNTSVAKVSLEKPFLHAKTLCDSVEWFLISPEPIQVRSTFGACIQNAMFKIGLSQQYSWKESYACPDLPRKMTPGGLNQKYNNKKAEILLWSYIHHLLSLWTRTRSIPARTWYCTWVGCVSHFFPCPNVAPMFSQNVYVRLLKISGASGRIKNQSEENMCCPYLSLPQWLSQDMYVLLFKISGVSRRN